MSSPRILLTIRTAICLGIILLPAACSKQSNPEPVKLGWIGALSGTYASLGQWETHGIELAIDEVNARGGVCGGRKLELVKYDDEANPTKSVALAQKLSIQDDILLVFATTNSNTALADLPVFTKNQIPQMTQSSSANLTSKGSYYIFRFTSAGSVFESSVVNYLVRKGYKKFAIISGSSAYGKGQGDYEQAALRNNGLNSLIRETYNSDDTDFSHQISRIAAADPEVLLVAGSEIAAGLITKQARELGFSGQIAGGPALGTPQFIEVAGDAAEGTIFSSPYISNTINEQARSFSQQYMDKWGYEPEQHGAKGYDGAMLAIEAINRSCTMLTRKEITRQLHNIEDVQGLQGRFSFQENGEGIDEVQLGFILNGQLSLIQE